MAPEGDFTVGANSDCVSSLLMTGYRFDGELKTPFPVVKAALITLIPPKLMKSSLHFLILIAV